MNDRNWGGKREGAGKKPLVRSNEEIPKFRGIKYNDIEWNKIKKWASLINMSVKGFLYFSAGLVAKDLLCRYYPELFEDKKDEATYDYISAMENIIAIKKESMQNNPEGFTLEQINAEIAAYRNGRTLK